MSVSATALMPGDFPAMTRESDLIVHGRVVDVRAQLAGPRRTIESTVTLQVATALKGTPGTVTTFRVPGGQVGRYRRVLVGAPAFAVGDEVIVFLKGQAPAVPMPYGLSQGVYRVSRQGAGAIVVPLVPTKAGRVVRGDPSRRPLDPAAFATYVRSTLSGAAPVPPIRRAAPRS
jgi:hypothetical protein